VTCVQEAFLSLLRISLGHGDAPTELTAQQWAELFELAEAHKLLPMIFEAGHTRLTQADPALAAAARRRARNHVILQTLRTGEFLELYRALEEAGIKALVVKGIVCRQLYPKPDHRPSSDEDLWIPPDQLSRCRQVLEAYGMTTTEANPDAWEFPYRKAGSPLYIELHTRLFPPGFRIGDSEFNGFFGTPHQHETIQELPGGRVQTLHPTDHMTYLLLHAFKHFLHSGFGIRQVCDILLFAHRHGELIDWEWVRLSCRCIRAEKFAAAVFAIGVRHLGFAPIGSWPEADEMPLLEDVLRAGIYGSADRSRQHSSTITLEAASARKPVRRGVLAAAFPSAQKLEARYPWLKKQPYLVPIAWADRMRTYLQETKLRPDSSLLDTLKLGSERTALLRKYGIVK
jgi:hypothetical protein